MIQIPPSKLLNYKKEKGKKKEKKKLNSTIHRLSLYVGSIGIKQNKNCFLHIQPTFDV